jgi:hypothetical protein
MYLRTAKVIYDKSTDNIVNVEKLKVFPIRSGVSQLFLPLLFNRELEVLSREIKQEKEIKNTHLERKR